jgi:glutathione S-transferase
MVYKLYYWPIQGRGEFIRLAFEEAGAPYVDVARTSEGMAEMMALMQDAAEAHQPFAPPFLKDGDALIGQTAAILFYLGPKLGLAPQGELERLWVHQIELTINDLVGEIHDSHHPVGGFLYYEDQKPEASRRSQGFRTKRIPKYLDWFENILERNPKGSAHLVGNSVSYADLSLFNAIEGLSYAFPRAMKRLLPDYPGVAALHHAVAARPGIQAYLASERRLPFSEEDIFRSYPELDG